MVLFVCLFVILSAINFLTTQIFLFFLSTTNIPSKIKLRKKILPKFFTLKNPRTSLSLKIRGTPPPWSITTSTCIWSHVTMWCGTVTAFAVVIVLINLYHSIPEISIMLKMCPVSNLFVLCSRDKLTFTVSVIKIVQHQYHLLTCIQVLFGGV